MTLSTSAAVMRSIAQLPEKSFIRVRDLEIRIGTTRHAVEVAMSRLAAADVVQSIGRGIYWKGSHSRTGMQPPSPLEVGIAIGGAGSGPADVSAVRFLGLTTQVPVAVHIAVPGRAPAPLSGVEFHSRSYGRALRALRPAEVAVLEVLRLWPSGVEADWSSLRSRVGKLVRQGIVRCEVISDSLADERTPGARHHWLQLSEYLMSSR
jgi:predicted transcriptional regulator of viral defense system